MKVTVCKSFQFEMAHQLEVAKTTKCVETIHGHTYELRVYLEGQEDQLQDEMVRDFGEIKAEVSRLILNELDHALMLPDIYSPEEVGLLRRNNKRLILVEHNPTAEWMATWIFKTLKPTIPELVKVRLYETPTSYAEAEE